MLGLVKSKPDWCWAAYGKHPVCGDFFRCGGDFPLMKTFSEWVEKGYALLNSKDRSNHKACSWRFWAKGYKKEMLVCGLVKDSSDKLGRPYPLLIIGAGSLKDWEDQWDLVPFACEKTWNQFEYLSAQRYSDLKNMEAEVRNIRPPIPDWSESKTQRESTREFVKNLRNAFSLETENDEMQAAGLSKKTECMICLDNKLFRNQTVLINYWHFLFKAHIGTIPNAIFMGGTIEKAYLVFFRRPLTPADFVKLWSTNVPG